MSKDNIKPIFIERFTELLGDEEYKAFESVILKPQRKSFRINTFKVEDSKKLINSLQSRGVTLEPILWDSNSFFVNFENKESRTDLGNLYEHFLVKFMFKKPRLYYRH